MSLLQHQYRELADFRVKLVLYVSVTVFVLLLPFTINNFVQGRFSLGFGSLLIMSLLALNAWGGIRGRVYSLLNLLAFVPTVILSLVLSVFSHPIIGPLWCYPAVLCFYIMLNERHAWIANAALVLIILPVIWQLSEYDYAIRASITLLAVCFFATVFVRIITQQYTRLHSLVAIDPLTGLLNRMLLQSTLEQAIEQKQRSQVPVTQILLDIDHFKTINDTLGHDAGDEVLIGIGNLLQGSMRKSDKVFRFGGEEFLVLLYNTDLENGKQVAEKLRNSIENYTFRLSNKITASAGVAAHREGEGWQQWLKRADENLYAAKEDGRNRVEAN